MSTEPETPPALDPESAASDHRPPVVVRNLTALRREAIVPSSDRARLAAILATCSLAGLAGGLALSMVAGAQHASASMRQQHAARDAAPLTWLGLQIVDACSEQRCDGARIRRVIPGSPADRAGFRPGDVVLRFDDDHIGSADELILSVRASRIGVPVDIAIRRGADEAVLEPRLGAMPPSIRAQIDPRR